MSVDCEHGQLKRSCNICELEQENAALKAANHGLSSGIDSLQAEISKLKAELAQWEGAHGLDAERNLWKSRAAKYKEALEKIAKVSQFGRENGPIVTSEHYEGAWLDCVEIAQSALEETE